MHNYIPVETIGGKDNWYMDISNLSLSELINLRDSLKGTISYRYLDGVIYNLTNISLDSFHNLNKRGYQRVNAKSRRYIAKNKRKRR